MNICSICGAPNGTTFYHNSSSICADCHQKLKTGSVSPEEIPRFKPKEEPSRTTAFDGVIINHLKKDYPAMYRISSLYRFGAFPCGLLSILAAVYGLATENGALLIISLVAGPIGIICNLAVAEGILIFLGIASHTRRSNEYLAKLVAKEP